MFQSAKELFDGARTNFSLSGIQWLKTTQGWSWAFEPTTSRSLVAFEELDGLTEEASKTHDVITGLGIEPGLGLTATVEGWNRNADLASQFSVREIEQIAEGIELADVETLANAGNHLDGRKSLFGMKVTRHERFHRKTIDCSCENINSQSVRRGIRLSTCLGVFEGQRVNHSQHRLLVLRRACLINGDFSGIMPNGGAKFVSSRCTPTLLHSPLWVRNREPGGDGA